MGKLVHGVGINDIKGSASTTSPNYHYYRRWKSMLSRAYSSKVKDKFLTYKTVTICNDWLTLSIFKDWMLVQEKILGDLSGYQLDKDIIFPGNKLYSPGTCRFISPKLNTLLTSYKSTKGILPTGVSFHKTTNKFSSTISIDGVNNYLGEYDTPEEAYNIYLSAKILEIIKQQKLQTDKSIIQGLSLHILELL